jgi:hypothetical protein
VVGWWVGSYPLSSQAPTPVEVELGCDKKTPPWKFCLCSMLAFPYRHKIGLRMTSYISLFIKS